MSCKKSTNCRGFLVRQRTGRSILIKIDYFVFENTKPGLDLKSRIQGYVSEQAGFSPVRIKLLCNPRYWGQKMNPLVCAYCYDEKQILRAIVAEVSNTPWNQRHCYLIPVEHQSSDTIIDKRFTVSPFNHLNMCYHWKSNPPQENHSIAIDVYEKNNRESAVLNTALMLKKQTLSGRVCRKIALNYPFHTLKVISLIYFQALKLLLKKVPFLGKDKYKSLEPE